tara:strand:- start:874 stop:1740 length:867 start_codon:yes stop_codon:yes gene_type:complete
MKLSFSKMNSQGNDFILVDNTAKKYSLTVQQIKEISSRDNIGCDQLLLLDIHDAKNVYCKIYNQDGSEAYQCGNGMRAIMSFLDRKYMFKEASIIVNNIHYKAFYEDDNNIVVNMGSPCFLEDTIASPIGISISKRDFFYEVEHASKQCSFLYSPIILGNFHCVVFSKDCLKNNKEIKDILYSLYSEKPNISYVSNLDSFLDKKDDMVELSVDERGSGWTQSCGSGASATSAFIIKYSLLNNISIDKICVRQKGGMLTIEQKAQQNKNDQDLYLTGPTTFDYDGVWNG